MLFVNMFNSNLVIYYEDGSYHEDIYVSGGGIYDATVINEARIAVSHGGVRERTIDIVNLYSKKLERSFPDCFKNWTWGISSYKGRLYVVAVGEGIKEIDRAGRVLRTINVEDLDGLGHVTLCGDRVYYSGIHGFITCADLSGNVIWNTKDDKIDSMGNSPSIATCSNNSLLVTRESENVVMAISKDGKDKTTLLNHSDGLDRPFAIHVYKDSVLICNRTDGQVFVYDIVYQ